MFFMQHVYQFIDINTGRQEVQCFIYFILPLGLAVIHSIVGLKAVSGMFHFNYESILISSVILVIIYGGYFYATYVGVKNIVKGSK